MKQAVVPLYIRFGEIPKDEKSKVYRSDSIVREEAGVSVWRAIENCGCYYPILPEEPNENTISDYFDMLWHNDKKVYLVTGTEMFIEGADREPLLMDVKILKEITDYYIHWITVLFRKENVIEKKIIRNRINFDDDFWINCMWEFKYY